MLSRARATTYRLFLSCVVALSAASCGGDLVAVPALRIAIIDSVSEAPRAYYSTVLVVDGDYSETIRLSEWEDPARSAQAVLVLAAENRPGVYSVRVSHHGYKDWEMHNIVVRTARTRNPFDGSAVPEPVSLTVRLEAED